MFIVFVVKASVFMVKLELLAVVETGLLRRFSCRKFDHENLLVVHVVGNRLFLICNED